MKIGRISFIGLVLLSSLSTIGDREMTRADADLRNLVQEPPPPLGPRFVLFRSLEGRLVIQEQETLIVGEGMADCAPDVPQIGFFAVTSDTPFVTLIDDSCLCPTSGSKFRFLISIAPQRGDAGKYRVAICGSACGVNPFSCFPIDIKVKAAL